MFFATPGEWRAWLEHHHSIKTELLVGFYKTTSGRPSITWPQSVDQALCYGWIDGVRCRIDDEAYSIRFTPRKPRGNWSLVNINRVAELTALGLMREAGVKAFEARSQSRTGIYSFEQETVEFTPEQAALFRSNAKAWRFFSSQPASYRKAATWKIINAKRPETRENRLANLIDLSSQHKTLPELTRKP